MEQLELSDTECKLVQPLWKTVQQQLLKLHVHLPQNSAILFLGVHPKEMNVYVDQKTRTRIFIAALFIILQNGKQPK